nr:hypothetical protein CFP56_60459 [Quercus suber]
MGVLLWHFLIILQHRDEEGVLKAALGFPQESYLVTRKWIRRKCLDYTIEVHITKSFNNLDIVLFSKQIGLMNMEKATSWTTVPNLSSSLLGCIYFIGIY